MLDGAASFITDQLLPGLAGIFVALTASAAAFRFIAGKSVRNI